MGWDGFSGGFQPFTPKRCGFFAEQSGLSIATANSTYVSWSAGHVVYDTDGFHDPASNADRITIPAGLGGIYLVVATAAWSDSTGAGNRQCLIYQFSSGGSVVRGGQGDTRLGITSLTTYQGATSIFPCEAGQYIRLLPTQNSGATKSVRVTLSVTRLSDS